MVALPHPVWPAGSLPAEKREAYYRQASTLWLALQILEPEPDPAMLESLAGFAQSLTPVVVLRPGEGLLLEVQGSLKYFAGLGVIRERLGLELQRRAWTGRLATAPTPLAASWIVRFKDVDITEPGLLAGAIGSLPLAATAWPDKVQRTLGQMGLATIADCLRLPRAGFARRIGKDKLDDLDRALGKKPDFRDACQMPQRLFRAVEFSTQTMDQAIFARALKDIAGSFGHELRQSQMQLAEIELRFLHLRCEPTATRIRFVDPVHQYERILNPMLARIERLRLAEPAIGLSLETDTLLPLRAEMPELLSLSDKKAGAAVPEYALVECLRGRFGTRSVYGIDTVAEHRPEYAWRCWIRRPESKAMEGRNLLRSGRPLWLLPEPRKSWHGKKQGQTPFSSPKGSDPVFSDPERIESGWWDGRDVRRDYHIVIGSCGEKLWFYRDCRTSEWYLHGIFG